jgi:HAMP domain-containing protein
VAGDLKGWPPGLSADNRVRNVQIEDDLIPGRSEDEDAYWPVLARRLPDGHRLLVAHGLDQAEALLDFTQGTMIAILAVSIALALGLGLLQGRALLVRIDALIGTARSIGAGRLNRRIPLSGHDDELDELAGQLNAMLDRIQALMAGMRQVTDNVAHDLRRPLSRVRNLLDVTAIQVRDASEYRETIGQAIDDLDEIIRTFNALIEIAQAEAGSFRGEWGAVDLSALAAEMGVWRPGRRAGQGAGGGRSTGRRSHRQPPPAGPGHRQPAGQCAQVQSTRHAATLGSVRCRQSHARNDRRPRTGNPARGARACPEALRPFRCGAQHDR